jgi:hypothetical protein
MKSIFLCAISTLFIIYTAYPQALDNSIKSIAESIGQQVSVTGKVRIAVGDILNNAGETDPLTKYVTEQLEIYLIAGQTLHIMDRRHIKEVLKEHNLQSEGLIDERTTKSAISFLKIQGLVLGEVTSFGNKKKITIRVIDISTSRIYAAATSGFLDDPQISELITSTKEQKGTLDCQVNNSGDYCFVNRVNRKIILRVYQSTSWSEYSFFKEIQVVSSESQCIYGLKPGVYQYSAFAPNGDRAPLGAPVAQGTIKVELCKSGNVNIREGSVNRQPNYFTEPNNLNSPNNAAPRNSGNYQRSTPRRTSNPRY